MADPHQGHQHSATPSPEAPATRDPVCGMNVDPKTAKKKTEHDGHEYHFCSSKCQDKFVAEPTDYITAKDVVCGMNVEQIGRAHV